MRFERDEAKRAANLLKHGIDFAAASEFDFDTAAIGPDLRHNYGELREIGLGCIKDRVYVLIYTRRQGVIRVISLRKANAREVRTYEALND